MVDQLRQGDVFLEEVNVGIPLGLIAKKDLFMCSNYEAGIRATRDFYCSVTGNSKYSPNNNIAFALFKKHHPELLLGLNSRQRPLHWQILWKTIRNHEEGICDCMCSDYSEIEEDINNRQYILDWLEQQKYLTRMNLNNAWNSKLIQYQLNWIAIKDKLGVDTPPMLKPLSLKPLSLEEIGK